MGLPDLGGIMDILAVFRGTDGLLFDLYDEPNDVKRVAKEIQNIWLSVYKELNDILQPVNPGFSSWEGLYSSVPSYVIQCDFSYMIGPDMFCDFVLDDLNELTHLLPNTIYHMDGAGEIPHLQHIISMSELNAVQWVMGAGAAPAENWIDLYKTIKNSGKNIQVIADVKNLKNVVSEIGSRGIYSVLDVDENNSVEDISGIINLFCN